MLRIRLRLSVMVLLSRLWIRKDDFSEQRIIQGMVGREMTDRFPKRPDVKIGDVSMEVKNWNVYHPLYSERKVVDNVSFKVHKGEVVGISGLMGAGRTRACNEYFWKKVMELRFPVRYS